MIALAPLARALAGNFLGTAPAWYKRAIVACLLFNPLLFAFASPFIGGWCLVAEFIFCLSAALRCYPLQPGGLLVLQALLCGLVSPGAVYAETSSNLPVLLLLIFMVAGIHFLRDLLELMFMRLLCAVESNVLLAVLFCALAGLLSAFLDALTVVAVILTVVHGFYLVYHRTAAAGSGGLGEVDRDAQRAELEQFRAFLRGLVIHAAVGTALGGVCTLVGEPQNVLVAELAGWDFGEFFWRMAPVSLPVVVVGLITCAVLERMRWFGFGVALPTRVRRALVAHAQTTTAGLSAEARARLCIQGVAALALVAALAWHVAAIGLIGLALIVIATSLNGIVSEHQIGHAFTAALPFTALLVVFFAVVAIIHQQQLFTPLIAAVLTLEGTPRVAALYLANGALSAISDNVFVATVYMTELAQALARGTLSRADFELLAVAVNTGTNIPSVATPNGQAAFLFLLTSALAPLLQLSYGRMVWMTLPYTATMTVTGLIAVIWWL